MDRLSKTVRQKCNACSSKPRFLERSFALSPNLCTNVRKEFTSCPSPKPFDTSGEKSSKIFLPNVILQRNVILWHDISKIISRTDSRLTSSQSGEIRKRKGGKKEEAVKRITGMINSRVAVAEARSEERAWRTTRVLIITIIRGQLRR